MPSSSHGTEGWRRSHLACADALCNDYDVVGDVARRTEGGDVAVDRPWSARGGSDAAAPRLVGVTDDRLVVAVAGEVLSFEPGGGEPARVPPSVDNGDACLVGGRLVSVVSATGPGAPQPAVPDTTVAGETIAVRDLETGETVPGSELTYDPVALLPDCVGGHLVVGPDGQPAAHSWTEAGWADAPATAVDWSVPPRAGTDAAGLVGLVDDRVVRVDPVSGEVVATAPAPEELVERGRAGPRPLEDGGGGPVSDLIALGTGKPPAVAACRSAGTDTSEVRCA